MRKEKGNKFYRIIDKYCGIPITIVLGWISPKHRKPAVIERIAILAIGGIGDFIVLSGTIADLRLAMPDAHIDVMVSTNNYGASKLFVPINDIIIIPISNPFKSLKKIKECGRYDLWIDIGPWARINSILSWMADAKFKIGFKSKGQARHFVYDISVDHRDDIHEIDNYRRLVKKIGISVGQNPFLPIKRQSLEGMFDCFQNFVVFHMFPSGYKSYMKEWPRQYWLVLASFCIEKGLKIVITGGSADIEKALAFTALLKESTDVYNMAGKLSLEDVSILMKKSKAVFSVNTGIMHLAAAVGAPLVAIHGPTSVIRWGPLSENSISVSPLVGCAPCLNHGFEYGCSKSLCLHSICPDQVIQAASKLWESQYI